MSAESDKAGRIAAKGLDMIDEYLDDLRELPKEKRSNYYAKNLTDCVLAAVKVQAEERAQMEFEETQKLGPEEVRALLKEYLAALPSGEFQRLVQEARPV
jgi:hypothetical protein